MTPLRDAVLIVAIAFAVLTVNAYRKGTIGNGDLMVRLGVFVVPLLLFSLDPAPLQWTFDELSFRKGGGHRILGATVLAVGVLYLFAFSLAGRGEKSRRDLTRLIENLALEQFRTTGHPEQFAGGVAVVIPAYNEASNIETVLGRAAHDRVRLPAARDRDRRRLLRRHHRPGPGDRGGGGAAPAQPRPGRGASHRLPARARHRRRDRRLDGRRRPAPAQSELSRLVQPIADGETDVVNGSRVLGDADPSHAAREMGIRLFAQLLSLLTLSRVTDPACGYRAVRTQALRGLEFRQDQFHNSEFIVEASKKRLRTIEVPVTVSTRLSGNSKKPPHFRYGMGFANALVRAWLR